MITKPEAKLLMDEYEARIDQMHDAFDILWKSMENVPRDIALLQKFNDSVEALCKIDFNSDDFDTEAKKYIDGRWRRKQAKIRGRIGSVS